MERDARGMRAEVGGRLTAEPDERSGGSRQRGTMHEGQARRNPGEPSFHRKLGGRGPLIIAAVDTVDPLLGGLRGTRLREPKPDGPDHIQPLEVGVARTRGRAELRALRGRDEDRPHEQDTKDGSNELGRQGSPHRITSKRNFSQITPNEGDVKEKNVHVLAVWQITGRSGEKPRPSMAGASDDRFPLAVPAQSPERSAARTLIPSFNPNRSTDSPVAGTLNVRRGDSEIPKSTFAGSLGLAPTPATATPFNSSGE